MQVIFTSFYFIIAAVAVWSILYGAKEVPISRSNRNALYILLALAVCGSLTSLSMSWLMKLPACKLCMIQRVAYFAAVALALAGLVFKRVKISLLLILSIAIFNFTVAGYHTGVLLGVWPDPCYVQVPNDLTQFAEGLFQSAQRCNKSVKLIGVPLPGWNMLTSAFFVATVVVALTKNRDGLNTRITRT